MAEQEELTRFYMSNTQLKDSAGQVDKSALKDWNTQVKQMTRALESATNGLVKVIKTIDVNGNTLTTFDVKRSQAGNAQPAFDRVLGNIETRYDYQAGSLAIDPYANGINKTENFRRISFHKPFHGALAQKTAKEEAEAVGATASLDPSKKMKDRMKIDFAVSENEWNQALQSAGGSTTKATTSLSDKFIQRNLKQAEKYSDDAQANQKEKEDKTSRRKMLHWLTVVVGFLTGIADITRRILTASLARASEIKRESVGAKALGISYTNAREYKAQETAMGMKEGTFTSAIASLQSAFGDVTHLDDNALGELAKVLKGDVVEAINNGLGRSNPEKLMKTVLNTYYERGQSGINSIGQQVGRYQAERELATALEKAGFNDLADVLRNMFYTNDTGIYKGRISTDDSFADYTGLVTAYTMGISPTERRKASELGAVIDDIKKTFNDLKDNLETGLILALGGVINKINNMQIGKSAEEKLTDNRTNIQLNQAAYKRLSGYSANARKQYSALFEEAGVNVADFGIEGVKTLEDFLAFTNTSDGRYWSPKGKKEKEAYTSMVQFLNTEKGDKAIKLVHYAQTTEELANRAKKDYEKGLKTGNTEYNKAGYTESAINVKMKENLPGTWFSDKYSAVNLLHASGKGSNAHSALYSPEEIYQAYVDTYGGLTYDKALASGDSFALTQALHDKLPDNLKGKAGLFGKVSEKNQIAAVKAALASGALTQEDVSSLAKENVGKESGWGISLDVWSIIQQSLISNGLNAFVEEGAKNNILNEALAAQQAQSFLTQANAETKVKATISGFNEKEGTVNIKIELEGKGIKVPETTFKMHTDSQLPAEKVFEQVDISSMVNSQLNGEATE